MWRRDGGKRRDTWSKGRGGCELGEEELGDGEEAEKEMGGRRQGFGGRRKVGDREAWKGTVGRRVG